MLENPFVVLTTYIHLHTESGPILQPLLSKTALCSSGGTVCETTWNSCHTGCSLCDGCIKKPSPLFKDSVINMFFTSTKTLLTLERVLRNLAVEYEVIDEVPVVSSHCGEHPFICDGITVTTTSVSFLFHSTVPICLL